MSSRASHILFPTLAALVAPGAACAGTFGADPELGVCKTKPEIMTALSRPSTQARAVPIRQRVKLHLSPERSVALPGASAELERERAESRGTTYAGLVRLEVSRPGVYRVGVDRDAWLDIATPTGQVLDPAPDEGTFVCDGVQKVLLYTLPAAGTYWLQIALSPRRETLLTVVPVD